MTDFDNSIYIIMILHLNMILLLTDYQNGVSKKYLMVVDLSHKILLC